MELIHAIEDCLFPLFASVGNRTSSIDIEDHKVTCVGWWSGQDGDLLEEAMCSFLHVITVSCQGEEVRKSRWKRNILK